MAKKVKAIIKLQIPAGQANPAPRDNIYSCRLKAHFQTFCKDYNERTSSQAGSIVPVEITVFEDRSFTFITKTPPTTDLLKKALAMEKGSSASGREKAGKLSRAQLREIAEFKAKDLNATTIEAAERIIEGTARSMGIEVE